MNNDPHHIRTIYVLFKKEMMAYFNSPIAYIFLSVFLIVSNWLFMKPFFLIGEASMRSFFNILPWILLFLSSAITMRLWAEEKKTGTIEFLLTLPISNWQLVLAKFFSAFLFLGLAVLLSITLPITLFQLGDLDLGPVLGGYFAVLGLGSAFLALGLVLSSLTKNQIIALISSLAICFFAFIISQDMVVSVLPNSTANIIRYLGLGSHYNNMIRGVVDTRDIIYFATFTFFFLWLNVKILEGRKWQ